jgi:hypothetical protein
MAAAAPVPDPLTVYVITFGPGDHPFAKFGHNAIWVKDRAAGTDRVYNFGTFKFESPTLMIPEFMRQRLMYWLSVSSLPGTLAAYEAENRTIDVQQLNLPPAAKRALAERLEANALPENRAYKYDYFLDNCATRVRDAIDRVAGGRLHDVGRAPGQLTWREQALRMSADTMWLYVALDLVLGARADQPIDRWAEMFLPEELARGLSAASLVTAEQTVFHARRPPTPEHPPARGVTFLLAGLALGLVFMALGWASPGRAALRALLGLASAIWGLAVGFIGCFLIYVWAFTDHVIAHRNENILLCAPWGILLAVLGIGVALGWRGAIRIAALVAVAAAVLAAVALAVKVHPAFAQHNGTLIGFFFPAWFGLALGLWHVRVRADGRSRL